jgi:hypothetical protein
MMNLLYCSKTKENAEDDFHKMKKWCFTWDTVGNVCALTVLIGVCDDDKWANENKSDVDLLRRVDGERHWSATASIVLFN